MHRPCLPRRLARQRPQGSVGRRIELRRIVQLKPDPRREIRLGRVRLVRPKATRPSRPHAQGTHVLRMKRRLRTNRLQRRRLGRVRLVRPKAIRRNRPHAQRTHVPRMKPRRRTNRLRRRRLGKVRLRKAHLKRALQNRALQSQVSPLRRRKSRPHRRRQARLRKNRSPSDGSLIRNGSEGPVLLAATGPFSLQACARLAFSSKHGVSRSGSVPARKCSSRLGGKSSSATIFYNHGRVKTVFWNKAGCFFDAPPARCSFAGS
jgi:hypothetical protein